MVKKIAILATDGYEDLELHHPRIRLIEAGYDPVIIGLDKNSFKGKHGYPATPEFAINEVHADEYDGVLIPGGTQNPDSLRRNQKVLDFVSKTNEQGKLVASICHGPWVLISAKVVKNRKATCYFAIKDDLINAGADYEDSAVVVDSNLITSRSHDDLPDFMNAVLDFLLRSLIF